MISPSHDTSPILPCWRPSKKESRIDGAATMNVRFVLQTPFPDAGPGYLYDSPIRTKLPLNRTARHLQVIAWTTRPILSQRSNHGEPARKTGVTELLFPVLLSYRNEIHPCLTLLRCGRFLRLLLHNSNHAVWRQFIEACFSGGWRSSHRNASLIYPFRKYYHVAKDHPKRSAISRRRRTSRARRKQLIVQSILNRH